MDKHVCTTWYVYSEETLWKLCCDAPLKTPASTLPSQHHWWLSWWGIFSVLRTALMSWESTHHTYFLMSPWQPKHKAMECAAAASMGVLETHEDRGTWGKSQQCYGQAPAPVAPSACPNIHNTSQGPSFLYLLVYALAGPQKLYCKNCIHQELASASALEDTALAVLTLRLFKPSHTPRKAAV